MSEGLRVVTFNVLPMAYRLVVDWAERNGHRLVLLVTLPGQHGDRYGAGEINVVNEVAEGQDVLITKRLRRTAAPMIAALEPDLIVSATFPRRIPPEVTAIPRYGALNLHPAPLPKGRGTTPIRSLYDGDLTVGASLHRIVPEFDAGAILSQRTVEFQPAEVTVEKIYGAWMELLTVVLDEGTRRAVAGEPGEPQDESLATYPAPFTEEECWLSWEEPALTVQRKAAALAVLGSVVRARIDGDVFQVVDARARAGESPQAKPGTVLDRAGDVFLIRAGEGAVDVTARPWSPPA